MKNKCNDCKKRKGIIEFSDNPYMALTHGWKTIMICRKCYIKRIEEHLTDIKKHLLNQKKYLMVEER